jgi:hypothetical protein
MNVLIGVVGGLILVIVLVRVLENRFIYFPPRYPEGFSPSGNPVPDVEEVWLTTKDNVRLNAWYLPHPGARKVLLWFHGNAENIGHGLNHLQSYGRLGVNVLALDYRGYGKSQGSPDEAGVYLDADAAYDYLVQERQVRPEDIVVFGHSLGGVVAIDLASRRTCGGLIVESSFTTAGDMARRMFHIPGLGYLLRTRFDSLSKIARVRAPVLVIHGTRDPMIPFEMARRLYEAAPEPKSFFPVEGAGHDDIVDIGGEPYLEKLRTFLASETRSTG